MHSTLDGDAAKQYFSLFNAKCITRGETFWQGGATFAKVWIVSETIDWVLVGHKSGDLRMGKMVGIIISDNGEVIKVIHKINKNSEFQVITNLKLLECHDSDESVENQINYVISQHDANVYELLDKNIYKICMYSKPLYFESIKRYICIVKLILFVMIIIFHLIIFGIQLKGTFICYECCLR